MIPYGRQSINEEDIAAVSKVLRGDFLTTGPAVLEFEKAFASYVGAKHAVAVANGTVALHLSCLAAGLKAGDELITTPITFVASANCALYCGAKPVLADVKPDNSGLIDPSEIKKKITSSTKVIIPVHYAGLPCDLKEIHDIAKKQNIKQNIIVIEDACHALGSTYQKSKIGDCAYSDMCVFSLHPVKHITTGEGGVITTNSDKLYQRLLLLRTHGITKDPKEYVYPSDGPWYYEMQELGYNFRITDFQCALGTSQLKRVNSFIATRVGRAKQYDTFVKKHPDSFEHYETPKDRTSSYHLYVIKTAPSIDRLDLFNYLRQHGVAPQVHYVPVHLHPYYQKNLNYAKGQFSHAESFYKKVISMPLYPDLTDEEMDTVLGLLQTYGDSHAKRR